MHEDERSRPIATGRMSALSLANSELLIGNDIDSTFQFKELLERSECYLLYPGDNSFHCRDVRLKDNRTIFILDGKWWQSREMLRKNLPPYFFVINQQIAFVLRPTNTAPVLGVHSH